MNPQQYAAFLLQLSALRSVPNALDSLDDEQLETLQFMLVEVLKLVQSKQR